MAKVCFPISPTTFVDFLSLVQAPEPSDKSSELLFGSWGSPVSFVHLIEEEEEELGLGGGVEDGAPGGTELEDVTIQLQLTSITGGLGTVDATLKHAPGVEDVTFIGRLGGTLLPGEGGVFDVELVVLVVGGFDELLDEVGLDDDFFVNEHDVRGAALITSTFVSKKAGCNNLAWFNSSVDT